jgi:hypothetical protein
LKVEAATASAGAAAPAAKQQTLAPAHTRDTLLQSLIPFAFRPAFRIVLGAAGVSVLAGLVLARFRAVRRNPQRLARAAEERAARAALHEADAFAAKGDVSGFFDAARRALQVRMAAQWGRPAHAITLADVAARIPADSPVVEIFREADRLAYSPATESSSASLTNWRARLQSAMSSLTTPAQA